MKKTLALILVMALALSAVITALAAAPAVKKVSAKTDGVVEVDFDQDVTYENTEVIVMDSAGNACAVSMLDSDDDDIEFRLEDARAGELYSYTVSGVRVGETGDFGSVEGSFMIPETKSESTGGETGLSVRKVEYDAEDQELEISFSGKVTYGELSVTVTDGAGADVPVTVAERDDDDIDVRVSLTQGASYTLTISGVTPEGGDPVTLTCDFVA